MLQRNITQVSLRERERELHLYLISKHICDFVLALFCLPILLIAAIFVKLLYLLSGDFAPIIYRHERIGQAGQKFTLYKFRTMVPTSDAILAHFLATDPEFRHEWEAYHKIENDPRITPVGKILRKTSIDELPQILNILKGEMSLIGPRPITSAEIAAYGDDRSKLLSLRPGLTGWWACHGRSCTSDTERRQLELYYCDHASWKLDLKCFALTVVKVLKQEGAK